MKSLSIDIVSWTPTEKLLTKYPTLTPDLLARYRKELNNLLDDDSVPNADLDHYIANLDRTYN